MNDLVLTLAIQFLPAVDAFAACCVSRTWNSALATSSNQDDDAVVLCCWKQVCKNSFPYVTSTFQENTDFRRLALGLYRLDAKLPEPPLMTFEPTLRPEDVSDAGSKSPRTPFHKLLPPLKKILGLHGLFAKRPQPPPMTFEPTLRYEDVFAVIDLYREVEVSGPSRKKQLVTEASFVCPMLDFSYFFSLDCGFGMTRHDYHRVILKGVNPYFGWRSSSQLSYFNEPYQLAARSVFNFPDGCFVPIEGDPPLRIRTTLFRRDNMKSVCILNESRFEWGGALDDWTAGFIPCKEALHLDENDKGHKAQLMLRTQYDRASVSVDARLGIEAILPRSGSAEEPQWLVDSRRQGKFYSPGEAHLAALREISHFEFRVNKLCVCFRGCNFRSKSDLMVVLEGLCWS